MRFQSRLTALHFHELAAHFLALSDEDRRLRFGMKLDDAAIIDYVNGIDFTRDAVFGVTDPKLDLIGVAHLSLSGDSAELGISVLPGARNEGIGSALLERAAVHARMRGIDTLYMHCLAANAPMRRLARKAGMRILSESGESEASLQLAAEPSQRVTEPSDRRPTAGLGDTTAAEAENVCSLAPSAVALADALLRAYLRPAGRRRGGAQAHDAATTG
jgi:hypothetical protein